jgi:hypothetical protein
VVSGGAVTSRQRAGPFLAGIAVPLATSFGVVILVLVCASLLFQKYVHPKFVQELLGHAFVAITLDTYSNMLPGIGSEAADAIGAALG